MEAAEFIKITIIVHIVSYIISTFTIWLHYWAFIKKHNLFNILLSAFSIRNYDIEMLAVFRLIPVLCLMSAVFSIVILISDIIKIYIVMLRLYPGECCVEKCRISDVGAKIAEILNWAE